MNFGLIGAAGYIAPRHMKAIKDTGNILVAALDPNDSIGIMDNYFPEADFFTEPERFDRHMDKLRRQNELKMDYVSICSPNYLHDAHIRIALRNQAHVICEKPLVLNPWNLDALAEIERETGKRIFNVLQLRLHPAIMELKKKVENRAVDRRIRIKLTYITSRGRWYFVSWKGDLSKSGGLITNIGVHFFDMLIWIFGDVKENILHYKDERTASGMLVLENAEVSWFLSLDPAFLPGKEKGAGKRTFRSLMIEDEEYEFSDGFADLHTDIYRNVLSGHGYGIEDVRPSIELVHQLRIIQPDFKMMDAHPLLKNL